MEESGDIDMVGKIEKLKMERLRMLAMSVDLDAEATKCRDAVKKIEGAIEALENEANNGS